MSHRPPTIHLQPSGQGIWRQILEYLWPTSQDPSPDIQQATERLEHAAHDVEQKVDELSTYSYPLEELMRRIRSDNAENEKRQ